MNALRWNPQGFIVAGEYPYNISGTFGLSTDTQRLYLTSTATGNEPVEYALPYANSPGCLVALNLTSTGVADMTFPWGHYVAKSPIRPLCAAGVGNPGYSFNLGDVIVTPTSTGSITANGWFNVASSIQKPDGFAPLLFTGTISKTGVVESAIEFSTDSKFEMLSPQVHYDYAINIPGRHGVGALVYNKDDGTSWYLASNAYNNDPANIYRIAMSVPFSCLLIFGTLDNTVNTVLPAKTGVTIYYHGAWNSKTLLFSELNVTITSKSDLAMSVTPNTVLSAGLDATVTFAIGFSGTMSKSTILLSHPGLNTSSWG